MAERILDFTDYESIRAVLGVDATYYTDETLDSRVYQDQLLLDMDAAHPQALEKFEELEGGQNPTPAQKRFLRAIRLFATYSVAKQLLPSLQFAVPRRESDNKASGDRFSDPLRETKREIKDLYDTAFTQLGSAVDDLLNETRPDYAPTLIVAVPRGWDPVTGEGG